MLSIQKKIITNTLMGKWPTLIIILSQNDFSPGLILENNIKDDSPTIPQLDGAVKNVFYGWSNYGRDEKMF